MPKQRMSTADVVAEVACIRQRCLGMRVANIYDLNSRVRTEWQPRASHLHQPYYIDQRCQFEYKCIADCSFRSAVAAVDDEISAFTRDAASDEADGVLTLLRRHTY